MRGPLAESERPGMRSVCVTASAKDERLQGGRNLPLGAHLVNQR